ncbi:hypothetical protein CLIB1444_02S14158 [[Candida] jaroonii]|uniref:Uncharacterized protein n=1 Tax=[Candida] jaroonii TaxID=467808 RepID=A0ACA9Y440_9ASCO|nr:hypothetical protein CLIB1444_02S14158 [[Candida] jaroonii]
MPVSIPHYHHDQINDNGFTVVRNFLNEEEVEYYKKLTREIVQFARDGKWTEVRTRGKQFPPWPKNFSPDIWGVSGLLHPDMINNKALQEVYSTEKILDIAKDILQCDKDDLSMELFNMLINPLTDFGLDWHRDYIKPEATPEEETEQLLANPFAGTQFNLSLTPDKCLIVIPKSHNRIRTEEEREKTQAEDRQQFISGQITVDLNPGDVVFYNSNILHRAQYDSTQERLTLHGSYGHKNFGKFRAKGVLQHGVGKWVNEFEPVNDNMKQLHEKLVSLSNEFKQDLGFSLDG